MSRVSDIGTAIQKLSPRELAQFRKWYEKFEAEQWDIQMEQDAKSGKFDHLGKQAEADYENGNITEF